MSAEDNTTMERMYRQFLIQEIVLTLGTYLDNSGHSEPNMTLTSQRVQARINGEILDPQEVADFLRFSTRKVVRLLKKGELPGKKIGGQWRTRRIDLDKHLSQT